jgi:glyoxylase-like metal-dependent hydrolase (beta-lactamase superfamily II)
MSKTSQAAGDVSRRTALTSAAAFGAAMSLGPRPGLAQSTAHRFKVGAAEIIVLSDGTMAMPLGWVLPDRKPEEVGAVFKEAGQTLGELNLQVNVTLIKLGQELILIDSGAGPDFAPARGKLPDNLEKAGIKPEAITTVVFTHAHPDHFWGLFDPLDGGSLFPKARHLMGLVERDTWLQPGIETNVADAVRGSALGTQRRLKELGGRLETYKAGTDILPGLAALDTAGHTPGHISLHLRSGSSELVIGGDALVEPVLSFARPEWRWGPDWDQDKAIASRKRLLDVLATDKIPLLGYHLPWPGLGRVERRGSAYRFVEQA